MSRKKRDAFRCTGTGIRESDTFVGVPLGLAFGESCFFGVLDVAVPLGFACQGVASKRCFRDKSQLKW